MPLPLLMRSLATAGFSGLWIDRRAYPFDARKMLGRLQRLLGSAPVISADGAFAFFDMRPFAARTSAPPSTGIQLRSAP